MELCIPENFADELDQEKPQRVSKLDVKRDTDIPTETRHTRQPSKTISQRIRLRISPMNKLATRLLINRRPGPTMRDRKRRPYPPQPCKLQLPVSIRVSSLSNDADGQRDGHGCEGFWTRPEGLELEA